MTYDNDLVPAGSLVTCGGQVRIATLTYATNGIQNGPNDGIALVNPSGQVVKFISYEGQIKASNGPAAGLTSTNLSVSETGSDPAGRSLRLAGTGTGSANFTWQAPATASFGTCNAGQTFTTTPPNTPPAVTGTTPTNGATDFPAAGNLGATFSESVTAAAGAFTLTCTSGAKTLTYPSSGTSFSISTNTALVAGEACTFTVVANNITDAGGAKPAANTVVNFNVASGGGGGTGYYAQVNTSSASQLRCSLHATIKGHTAYPYSGGTTNTWTILEIADEDPLNAGRVLDVYRNHSYAKITDRAGGAAGIKYNREHTWPKSLGFSAETGNLGLPNSPHTDTHMLYLSDANYNSDRGNKPYGNCSGCTERADRSLQRRGRRHRRVSGQLQLVQRQLLPDLGQAQRRYGARGAVHGDSLRRRHAPDHRPERTGSGNDRQPRVDRRHLQLPGVHGPVVHADRLAPSRSAGCR